MKLLYNILALMAITVVLVVGGLVIYLLASGRLDAGSANLIAAALRGEKLVPEQAAVTTTAPATTQPADKLDLDKPMLDLASTEIRSAVLEQQLRVVKNELARLKDGQLTLIQDREALAEQVRQFEQQVALRQKADKDEGFNQALAMYTKMKPKQAKEDFMKLGVEVVVRYLMNMPKRNQVKILQEFKSPQEQDRRREITERIRTQELTLDPTPENEKAI